MSQIQRQQATIDKMTALCRGNVRKGFSVALSSIKRAHVRQAEKMGYSRVEAVASLRDCIDMARLELADAAPLELN